MVWRNSSNRSSSSALLIRAAHCISRRRRIRSISFSWKLWIRLRPASLAAAQALSAALNSAATSSLSAEIGTTPILTPSRKLRSSHMNLYSLIAIRSDSADCMASSSEQLSSSTPNSSPPRRARVSRQRILDLSSAPSCPSNASPALWPHESLTILNWSRSR